MDLSALFSDERVTRKKTHIVMKSVGVESKNFRGWQHPPTLNNDGTPAHALFPAKQKKEMEALGWIEVKAIADPSDALEKKATTKKVKSDVEG